jgi:hypothetical protein
MDLAAPDMSDNVFLGYIGALAVSGVILLVLAATGFGATGALVRVLNALFGLGFVGYAVYLLFFFQGGDVAVFYYVFILPVLMLIQAFKGRASKNEQPAPAAEG